MIRVRYPEMALVDPKERARLMALRSLHHCRVIRVDINDGRAPLGFRILQAQGYLNARRANSNQADCRLNEAGLEFARKALK